MILGRFPARDDDGLGVPFGHPDPAEGVSREERLAGENTRLRAALTRLASDDLFLPPDPDGALALGFGKELRARYEFARAALSGGQA